MKIRRLEIQGFKSFAERTVLTFGEGITGVVGPNGCGKSNIVDAIRWAMGEQSAKHLRGTGMQDIIFAGSESRGPVGMAEVTLSFKNDGSLVPPEYQKFEEISVTRRLFRDGTSEYAINKVVCRLRDVLDLFMGTGVGRTAYSIIEQGRIGLIVTAKPEDRRAFIEEAAGISRYKARRKQAERRIEATEQNLLRVNDITAELKQRIGTLERQAKKAEKYKRLKGQLKALDLCASAHRYFELSATERFIQAGADQVRERLATEGGTIEGEEAQVEAALAALQQKDQDLRAREAQIAEHQQALALAENNAEFLGREREGQQQRRLEAEEEHARLAAERLTLESDRAAAEALSQELGSSEDEERSQLAEEERALEERRAQLEAAEQEIEADKQAMVSMLTTIAKHNNNLQNLDRSSTDLEARLARAQQANQIVVERLRELEKEAKQVRHELNENRQLKLALEDRRAAQESLHERLREELSENEADLLAARQELMDRRSRLGSLNEIHRKYEGCADGVRSIMRRRDEDPEFSRVLHGLVADFVSAEPRYEAAVEALLGERLQYVIVSSQTDGIASVEYLRSSAEGRSSFIPLDLREDHASWAPWPRAGRLVQTDLPFGRPASHLGAAEPSEVGLAERSAAGAGSYVAGSEPPPITEPPIGAGVSPGLSGSMTPTGTPIASPADDANVTALPGSVLPVPERADDQALLDAEPWPDLGAPGVCGRMLDLVTTPAGYERIARVLLGDVVIVEDLAAARRLWVADGHRKTLVTLSGEVLDPVGVVTGGSSDRVSSGMLAQKREIKALTEQVQALDVRVRIADERHSTLKSRITELDHAIRTLGKEGHQEELSIVRLERDLRRIEENLQRHQEERKANEDELASIMSKQAEAAHEMAASHAALEELEERRVEVEGRLQLRGQDVAALKETVQALAEQVTALKVKVAANAERREGSERNLARIIHRMSDVEERLAHLAEVIAESETELGRLEMAIAQARAEATELAETVTRGKADLDADRERLEVEARTLRELDASTRSKRKALDALKSELGEAQMRLRELELARQALVQQIDERYRLQLTDLLADYHQVPPQTDEDRAEMEKLRAQIDGIGAINLTAIEEFNEVNERYGFLAAQKDDLESAIAQLRSAIRKINRTSKDRYVEAFRLVNEKFQQVFPRLFNGGCASLVMLDESDPLESGIEMLAQPPGKKPQSVGLLSGGEKALTAVSLIFSIFLIKPTPFCLLDEVDAPLDEANVGRYNELVKDMSQVSQFIIITHNKRTMELPDRLYGVTMEEPGISKIVPVDVVGGRRHLKAAS